MFLIASIAEDRTQGGVTEPAAPDIRNPSLLTQSPMADKFTTDGYEPCDYAQNPITTDLRSESLPPRASSPNFR